MYYPALTFVELDGYKLSNLIIPLIQLIMFGMGDIDEFWGFYRSGQNSKKEY